MYQSVYYDREERKIHIWDDHLGHLTQRHQNYGYVKNPAGLYTALDGEKVKKVNFFKNIDQSDLYETDVHPEMRALIDRYWDSDDISTGHTTLMLDIEVESTEGFPQPDEAKFDVTAISMYIKETDKFFELILDQGKVLHDMVKDNIETIRFDSEEDLLLTFIELYSELKPTILTGWNIVKFDIPYLYNRMNNTLGDAIANKLSPIGIVKESYKENGQYEIAGVNILDYIDLYKKFELNQKPSYTLDAIAKAELGHGKVSFEGSIQNLFETDIDKFMEYSLNDVVLIKELDEKLDYIEQTKMVCHMGHVKYEDIMFSSKYIEGTILTYLKNHGIIAPNRHTKFDIKTSKKNNPKGAYKLFVEGAIPDHIPTEGTISYRKSPSVKKELEYHDIQNNAFILTTPLTEAISAEYLVAIEFIGAYVKPPIPGKYDWVYDLDLKSMYPFTIMSLNISPETKVGYVSKFSLTDFIDNESRIFNIEYLDMSLEYNSTELRRFLEGENLSVSANGILYRQDKRGLIPTILENWSFERDRFKGLRTEAKLGGDKKLALYYNRKQGAQKVLLNSLYGVLGLPVFRFYDIQNATAVTSSGRSLLMHTTNAINYWYNKILNDLADHVIYSDTDSCFVSALAIIRLENPGIDESDIALMVKKTMEVADRVQSFINTSYAPYAKSRHNLNRHGFKIKQELVAQSGLFIAKKRYAQYILNEEGVPCSKLDVKGIDSVKSNFPPVFRKFIEKILEDILKDGKQKEFIDDKILDLQGTVRTASLTDIARPSSVNNLNKYAPNVPEPEKFTQCKSGAPQHVKAAVGYNDMLRLGGLTVMFDTVRNGDKVKTIYLRENPFGLDVMAFRGYDDPPAIIEYITEYVDYDRIFEANLSKKLLAFYSALNWGELPTQQTKLVNKFF